ncbi:MAG TPA: hypothetical protein VFS12_13200 [Terriglobia bacterium]|nr:hypothetical protein [Terriglobia bacterium]
MWLHPAASCHWLRAATTWEGELANSELSSTQGIVSVLRQAGSGIVWTPNPLDKKAILWRSVEERAVPTPERIILVLDSSAGMTAHLAEAANSLNALPTGVELVVLIASDDGGDLLTPVQMVTPELLSALTDRIRAAQCEGGRSNVAALLRAWDLAVASDCGMVVWVHGPIRELTDAPEPFLDRWRSRRDNQSPAPKGPGAAGLASGSGEIGFDLHSSWYQSGTPYDGLILFPVTLFLFARLLLGAR